MYRILFLTILFLFSIAVSAAPPQSRYGALPEPIFTTFRTFAIPFEILPGNSADPTNEVELFVSTDQGKKWFSAGKTGIAAKKFQFTAENEGEYWFSFRTITLSGAVKQSSAGPQLRVIVQKETTMSSDSREPATVPPDKPEKISTAVPSPDKPASIAVSEAVGSVSTEETALLKRDMPEYGSPVSPPKPLRLEDVKSKAAQTPEAKEAETSPQVAKSVKEPVGLSKKYPQMPLLANAAGEVFKPDERVLKKNKNESVPVEELFSRLNQFYGGKLNEERITPLIEVKQPNQSASIENQSEVAQAMSTVGGLSPAARKDDGQSRNREIAAEKPQSGKITGISLNTSGAQPQITVKWNRGEEVWGDAARGIMVDVLRGKTSQGPWLPLTTNLKNSGEYWWYLSQDDLMPFYLMIRLRTLDGVVAADFTPSPIQINPALLGK